MTIDQKKSAIFNLVMDGLQGASINSSLILEQVEDELIIETLKVIDELNIIGKLNLKDVYLPLRGLNVTCGDIERICDTTFVGENIKKVEIPQIITSVSRPLDYFGSKDMRLNFRIYTDLNSFNSNKYRRSTSNNPYVFVDTTPNTNNMNDAFIFNAPFIDKVTVIGAFKDPRQVESLGCCTNEEISVITSIDTEVIKRLAAKYIDSHRKLIMAPRANTQQIL